MEAVLRPVADESRRTLLEALAAGPASAGDLAALLPLARPGVSRHLRVLQEAGLVEVCQEAQRKGDDMNSSARGERRILGSLGSADTPRWEALESLYVDLATDVT